MKLQIDQQQLNELSDKAKTRLKEWFFKREIQPNLLSTAQMIELIGKRLNVIQTWDKGWYRVACYEHVPIKPMKAPELCDALWMTTKRILENYSIEI